MKPTNPSLLFLSLLLSLGWGVTMGHAEERDTAAEVMGSQALRPRLGNPASWRITTVDATTLNAKKGSPATNAAESEMISVDRNDKILQCTLAKSATDQDTYWFTDKMIIEKRSGSPTYFVIPPNSEIKVPVDFTHGDFPELDWIKNLMSSGKAKVNGIPCYIFIKPGRIPTTPTASNSNTQAPTAPPPQCTAYIDIANARPLLIIEGGMARQYSYPPPPSVELPAGAKAALAGYTAWFKKTFPPMSRP